MRGEPPLDGFPKPAGMAEARAALDGADEPPRPSNAGRCQHHACRATHAVHKWGNIKAHGDGWYMMRDGREWCPDHRPEWAPAWPPE